MTPKDSEPPFCSSGETFTVTPLESAMERLRAGAALDQTVGGEGGHVALYEDHCKALLVEVERLREELAAETKRREAAERVLFPPSVRERA